MPDKMPEDMPDRMPKDMPDRMPEDMPDRMSDKVPEGMPDKVPECLPDRMPDDLPDDMSEDMPEDVPDRMPNRMPEDMPDRMPDRMPEDMSDGMPEDMPDRMSEDLPVTKRINVMVGITRSKVIVFVYSSTVCGWLLAKVQHRLVLRHWACVPVPRTRPSILNDGKGNGLTCLAGHMPMVGTHEAICNMPRQRPAGGSQITRPAAIACACCVNPGSSHVLLCAPVPSRPT